jgi:hypothetical protein
MECLISGFRLCVDDICALLGYYAVSDASYVPTFRDNISDFLSLENVTDVVPKLRYITTNQCCVISRNSAVSNAMKEKP